MYVLSELVRALGFIPWRKSISEFSDVDFRIDLDILIILSINEPTVPCVLMPCMCL